MELKCEYNQSSHCRTLFKCDKCSKIVCEYHFKLILENKHLCIKCNSDWNKKINPMFQSWMDGD